MDSLPTALYGTAQVRELDARLIASGIPGIQLMQRAAAACWAQVRALDDGQQRLTVLAGKGNNAGDGYLVAESAARAGWQVQAYWLADPVGLSGDAATAHGRALAAGVHICRWEPRLPLSGVLLDALLGSGLQGELVGDWRALVEQVNAGNLPVVAVDIPSGLDGDTGHVHGVAVRATCTVTFIGLKLGLLTGQGPDHSGMLCFDGLQAEAGILAQVAPLAVRLTPRGLPCLPGRPRSAHKGMLGHLLVVGGDHGMGGAVLLAAQAALRSGAGLVSIATRQAHVAAALARLPEVMTRGVASANQLQDLLARLDVLVLGPGLGQQAWGRSLGSALAGLEMTQLWDADALNLLAAGRLKPPSGAWVITPHPGEAARLLGWSVAEVGRDRLAAARALAAKLGAVVVLKGLGSLVVSPDGRVALCDQGHPAMAGAGFGDVLSGVIGALLAQGMPCFEAACLGVALHAQAGTVLGRQGRGLRASELCDEIRLQLEASSPCLQAERSMRQVP